MHTHTDTLVYAAKEKVTGSWLWAYNKSKQLADVGSDATALP